MDEDDNITLDDSTAGQVVEQPVDTSAVADAPAPPAGPATMLEAIERGMSGTPAAEAQPRDPQGRFTFKNAAGQAVDADGNVAPDQDAALAAQAAKAPASAAPEDLTKMPDGLSQPAQQRFQKLANTNREQAAELERFRSEILPGVQAMQQTWTENQVQPEQFTQAMGAIGMINRGDFDGAEKVLREQLQIISLLRGSAPEQIDPLAGHPELRQRVQQLVLSEEDAIKIARGDFIEGQRQQRDQQAQARAQQQATEQQAVTAFETQKNAAINEIDAFFKQVGQHDMDFPAIEKQLVPHLRTVLDGVSPDRWLAIAKSQYQIIKQAASAARGAPSAGGQALRPTGASSGAARPNNMFDAMFPNG